MRASSIKNGHLNILIFTRKPKALPSFDPNLCTVRVVEVTKNGDGSAIVPDNTGLVICYPVSHGLMAQAQRRADALGIPLVMAKTGASGLAGRVLENAGIDLRPYLAGHVEEAAPVDAEPPVPTLTLAEQIRTAVAQTVPRLVEEAVAQAVNDLTELFLEELSQLERRLAGVERSVGMVVDEIEERRERHRAAISEGVRKYIAEGGKIGRPMRVIPLDVLRETASALKEKRKSMRQIANETGIPRSTLLRRMNEMVQ